MCTPSTTGSYVPLRAPTPVTSAYTAHVHPQLASQKWFSADAASGPTRDIRHPDKVLGFIFTPPS